MNMKSLMAGMVVTMALVMGSQAWGQGIIQTRDVPIPSTLQNLTNTTVTSTAGTAADFPAATPGLDIGVWLSIVAAGNSRSNTTVGLEFTLDGTNWTTTHPLQVTVAANDTTTNTGYASLSYTNWIGVKQVRVGYVTSTCITNHTVNFVRLSWTH